MENLQRSYSPSDGIVVAANHSSWFDPLTLCHVLWENGRSPRFLAKYGLFTAPAVGSVIRRTGHIPVHRQTGNAADSIKEALAAIADGETIVIYPEGTITRDPNLWPMTGKTGAARIALLSGAPVIPIAQWGPEQVMRPYRKEFKIFPRKTMRIKVGAPVKLDDLRDQPITGEILTEATNRIMDAITTQLAELRNEPAPESRLDYQTWKSVTHTELPDGNV